MPLAQDAAVAVREVVQRAIDEGGRGAQRRFADAMSVRPQTVSKWLSGENDIPQWRWLEVEDALGLAQLDLARAAGLELDIAHEEVATTWYRLFPRPTSDDLMRHLEAVDLAMKEGRPIPRRHRVDLEVDETTRVDRLEERLEAIEATIRRLEALVGEAVGRLEVEG